ncbi:MAG: hypothetical protein ACPGSB_05835 [Opitutales bacterium]
MSETPDKDKINSLPEDYLNAPIEADGPAPRKTPIAPSKPVKAAAGPIVPPKKPAPKVIAKPEPKPVSTKPASANSAKPISIAPKADKPKSTPARDSSISYDKKKKESDVSVVSVAVDGVAAAVAIIFTVLILQDALPFL